MITYIRVTVGASCIAMLIAIIPMSSAHAETIWQLGVQVGNPHPIDWTGENKPAPDVGSWSTLDSCAENGAPLGEESRAVVKRVDDLVYVKDECADGRSAMGQVTTDEGGNTVHRYCRNKYGNGTWARCNFNWPDNGPFYQLTAGSYNANTGYLHWDYGQSVYFSD